MKTATTSFEKVFTQLEAWGSESARKINAQHGAGENQFGVSLGNLRGLAKKLKTNHALALELWATGSADAMSVWGGLPRGPRPKGCTSTYAPEWIAAVLKRKK